jgi:esterase/lipase superfamily enzyme
MGEHVVRQTPKAMPSTKMIDSYNKNIPKSFSVAGSRGTATTRNIVPDFAIHSAYRFTSGSVELLQGKHVYIYIHGYNLTAEGALSSARDFFRSLHTALVNDGQNTANAEYVLFTWPGDTGTAYFDDAQQYAQHSGVALFKLLQDCEAIQPLAISLITHSLGAHVALRGLSVLGERLYHHKAKLRVDHVLLLGAAVEDDVFSRPTRQEEYHFPDAAFGMKFLHMVISRSDNVLGNAFFLNEQDRALGFSGPETMDTLVSLDRRVKEVLDPTTTFSFELHDFSTNSATIMDPELHVRSHGGYWTSAKQVDYYVNFLR